MYASLKLAAVLLTLSAIASPASATPRDHDRGHRDRDHHGYYDRDDRHDRRDRRKAYRHGYRDGYRADYRDDRREYRHDRPRVVYHHSRYYAPRPVVVYRGPPRWARGGRYYDRGYGPTYVVRDYGHYGLRRPPSGYYWRRSDAGDFLMVALATGIIADLVLHH